MFKSDLSPTHSNKNRQTSRETEGPTTLKGLAKKAKLKGEKKVTLPAPIGMPAEVPDWNYLLSNYSIVVAEPLEKSSRLLDPHHIGTFIKFRLHETLSSNGTAKCCGVPRSLPDELSPLNAGEIYVLVGGGTINLEGVEVTHPGLFSEVMPSTKYLLFLIQDGTGKIATINLDSRGIFRIETDGNLEPLNDKPNDIKKYIDGLYNGSFHSLKNSLRAKNAPSN